MEVVIGKIILAIGRAKVNFSLFINLHLNALCSGLSLSNFASCLSGSLPSNIYPIYEFKSDIEVHIRSWIANNTLNYKSHNH